MNYYLLLTALIISSNLSYGQSPSVSGEVYSEGGEKLPGVYVQLNNQRAAVTNEAGWFAFENLETGNYAVTASFVGFQTVEKNFTLVGGETLTLKLELKEEVTQLSEVTVTGKSEAQELRESTASVAVLETQELYTQSNNTSDVIKQISGVNVRQTGGFGSEAEVSISGMSGNQVKFFLDGIPLTYFGSGLGLNVLPVNLMEQIEVYKGVVPVHLGADALGGAINIVSRKEYSSYLDVAYSFGSFSSHRANLNGQFSSPETNFLVGINAFYNHSDNNYFVDVEIPNEFGNPEPARVRRFHDQFSNYLLNAYAGVVDKPYADRLILSVRYSGLDDDIQHNAIMAQPYGEVVYNESTQGLSLEYEKRQMLPNTDLQWYGGMNHTVGNFTDTTLNAYTWDGEVYRRRTDGGEISASRNLLQLNSRNAVSRLNVNHKPWKNG
ncbi:MAG: TonB-dependent receptor plug domain-containing protein, partial [Bacteroidota bacterium]